MDETVKLGVCHMLTDAIVDEVGGIERYKELHNKMLELSAKLPEQDLKLITMMGRDVRNLYNDEKGHRNTVKTMHKILGCTTPGE